MRMTTGHPGVTDPAHMATTPPLPSPRHLERALPWPVANLLEELLVCCADWPVTALVEELLACYDDWRDDAAAVAEAYRRWSDAPADEGIQGFLAYNAALDQEESAAMRYAMAVADVVLWLQRAYEGKTDR